MGCLNMEETDNSIANWKAKLSIITASIFYETLLLNLKGNTD
jgi:hypothetical protein